MTSSTCRHQILTLPTQHSLMLNQIKHSIKILYQSGNALISLLLLLLSGLTDVLDGWIARRFHAVSDLGKVLDPVADKLTLLSALAMLLSVWPTLIVPLVLLIIRETLMGITGALAVARTGNVPGAVWHGKVNTALLYLTLFLHILWQDIPRMTSNTLVAACTGMLLLSMVMYLTDNVRRIRRGRGGE